MNSRRLNQFRQINSFLLLVDLIIFYWYYLRVNGDLVMMASFIFLLPFVIYFLPWSGLAITLNDQHLYRTISFYVVDCVIMGTFIYFDFPWPLQDPLPSGGIAATFPFYVGVGVMILIAGICYLVLVTIAFIIHMFYIHNLRK